MKKTSKKWLVFATALTVVGAMICAAVMGVLHGDFRQLSTVVYQTNEQTVAEPYTNIAVVTDTADVIFVPTEDDTTLVTCYEQKQMPYAIAVVDGTLTITHTDKRRWYEHIGIDFERESITVALPKGEYGTLSVAFGTGAVTVPTGLSFAEMSIAGSTGHVTVGASVSGNANVRTSTGDIRVEKAVLGSLDVAVSTGKVTLGEVTCQETLTVAVSTGDTAMNAVRSRHILSDGSTGKIVLRDVIVAKTLFIERSTGDVNLERCDAEELTIRTDTGDVNGSLLTDKVCLVTSDTGRVDVPRSTSGGKCEITTDTGDVRLVIEP